MDDNKWSDVSLDPITRTVPADILYVTTICPQISRNLVSKIKSKIQIGRLDIFPDLAGDIIILMEVFQIYYSLFRRRIINVNLR